ncbi:hypothetical protein ACFQ51_47605 [Streptomyces kaempferi]
MDTQHNTSGAVSHSSGRSASKGVNFMAFGLAPVVPGVWLGGAVTANAQPFLSSTDTRVQKAVSEPRVLRSDKGSVEIPRKVRYGIRIKRQGEAAQTFRGGGTLTMRVPVEHLVPVTAQTPAPPDCGPWTPRWRTGCGSRTPWPRSRWTMPRRRNRAVAGCSTPSAPCCIPP